MENYGVTFDNIDDLDDYLAFTSYQSTTPLDEFDNMYKEDGYVYDDYMSVDTYYRKQADTIHFSDVDLMELGLFYDYEL